MLTYEQARQKVIEELTEKKGPRATEQVRVGDALGYVLAQEVKTDREYPPFNRATRDGYAVFAADAKAGATLKCTGEIKAGDRVTKELWADAFDARDATRLRGACAGGAGGCGRVEVRLETARGDSFDRG